MSISLIAAISKNNVIGRDNDLPWHIPEDLDFFKKMTKGKIVMMGRKTWESIPEKYRPLPGRTNVVISRQLDYKVPEGVYLFEDVDIALNYFKDQDIMISGGGQIYTATIDKADILYITHVNQEISNGHAFFPEIDMTKWKEVERTDRDGYSFVTYKKNCMKGKFIVLYGINNLGKSTQTKMLVERLRQESYKAEYLKYPVYDLEPSGKLINEYLREGNPYNLSAREIQLMYVWNREQYEPTLRKKLESGVNIIAEDYVGTGLSWGIGTGVDEQFMKKINAHLYKEDIAFLFDGARFTEATENSHKHETNDELMEKVRDVHARLGEEFGWIKIDANDTIQKIHEQIWTRIKMVI